MTGARRFLERCKTEYGFRTFAAASGSLAVTGIFALYNGFLGICHSSVWHGCICAYYIFLVLLRGLIIRAATSEFPRREQRNKNACLTVSVLLLILNLVLIQPLSIMVRQQRPVSLTLIPAIAMAAYTTYKVTMASVNLRRRKRSSNRFVHLLRTISFIDALVSVLTLQNTLIMVKSNGEGMLALTAATSAAVWIAVLILSVAAVLKQLRDGREQACRNGIRSRGSRNRGIL